jgi:hypothetical protein
MMMVRRAPSFGWTGIKRRLVRHGRRWMIRLLWRLARLVLLASRAMLRLGLIDPIGMRRAWRPADRLETSAEMLWRLRQ